MMAEVSCSLYKGFGCERPIVEGKSGMGSELDGHDPSRLIPNKSRSKK
jgi:hypothetical protein